MATARVAAEAAARNELGIDAAQPSDLSSPLWAWRPPGRAALKCTGGWPKGAMRGLAPNRCRTFW